jgi:tetraacyldisaccharide 4'-kinase
VISVGNLTTGGTGKTPVVRFLAELLLEAGYQPSILSRGYRGSAESTGFLVSDGNQIRCGPEVAGDEAFLLAERIPDALVAVGKNRWQSGHNFESRFENVVHLLDDGFQHVQLHRDLDLLLIDATTSLDRMNLLPSGNLREPLDSLRRADAVLLTRSHLVGNDNQPKLEKEIELLHPTIPLFPFHHEASAPIEVASGEEVTSKSLENQAVAALAAIGNPEQFLADLKRLNLQVKERLIFRDHHRFSHDDLDRILAVCERGNLRAVITTEKDAVRLRQLPLPRDRFYALPIVARSRIEDTFKAWFLDCLSQAAQRSSELEFSTIAENQ